MIFEILLVLDGASFLFFFLLFFSRKGDVLTHFASEPVAFFGVGSFAMHSPSIHG